MKNKFDKVLIDSHDRPPQTLTRANTVVFIQHIKNLENVY